MSIVNVEKQKSWTDLLSELKNGKSFKAPYVKVNTIRNRISHQIKQLYPERSFETEKAGEFIIVKRIA